jgi:hypothetical protein
VSRDREQEAALNSRIDPDRDLIARQRELLRMVGQTLEAIGVPAGSTAWRLGWLEGRELGRGGGR